MCPSACLGQSRADIYSLNLIALLFLFGMWHGVCDNKATETAAIQVADGIARKDGVSDNCIDFLGPVLHNGISSFDESAASVGHIIDNNRNLVLNVSNKYHSGNFVGASSLFVDEGELKVEAIGDCSGSINQKKKGDQ
jgi:hypothetical protein